MVQASPLGTWLSNDNQCYYNKDPDGTSLGSLPHPMLDTVFTLTSKQGSPLPFNVHTTRISESNRSSVPCFSVSSGPSNSLVCASSFFSYKIEIIVCPPHRVELRKLRQVKYFNHCLAQQTPWPHLLTVAIIPVTCLWQPLVPQTVFPPPPCLKRPLAFHVEFVIPSLCGSSVCPVVTITLNTIRSCHF